MKTNWFSDSGGSKRSGVSLFQKTLVVSLAMVLLLAALPAPSAFAAPASADTDSTTIAELEQAWKNKILQVEAHNLFYEQVRLFPADFRRTSDLDRAWDRIHQYGAWLRRANTIIATHDGFDWAGNVIHEKQADKTVRELAMVLKAMRGLMMKLEAQEVKFHRVRQPSGSTAQPI